MIIQIERIYFKQVKNLNSFTKFFRVTNKYYVALQKHSQYPGNFSTNMIQF